MVQVLTQRPVTQKDKTDTNSHFFAVYDSGVIDSIYR